MRLKYSRLSHNMLYSLSARCIGLVIDIKVIIIYSLATFTNFRYFLPIYALFCQSNEESIEGA